MKNTSPTKTQSLPTVLHLLVAVSVAVLLVAAPACGDSGGGSGGGLSCASGSATWEVVQEDLDGSLMSVWTDGSEVFTAGAGGLLQRFDCQWTTLDTGTTEHLWWVHGRDDALWIAGENGTTLRYDRAADSFEAHTIATEAKLFGIWGQSDTSMWTVGGVIGNPFAPGEMYHFDGTEWSAVELPDGSVDGVILYKVWGRSDDDLWVVGTQGTILHRTASGWEVVDSGTTQPLFTVSGDADIVVAVGGVTSGIALLNDGDGFVDASPDFARGFNGVHVRDGAVTAVGTPAEVWRRDAAGVWTWDESAPELGSDGLHAVMTDGAGHTWAVGGEFQVLLVRGAVVHYGPPVN